MKSFTKTHLSFALSLCLASAAVSAADSLTLPGGVNVPADLLPPGFTLPTVPNVPSDPTQPTDPTDPVAGGIPSDVQIPKLLNLKFELDPTAYVDFSDAEQFTPLEELAYQEYTEEEESVPERQAFDLSAVAVTPEGEAYVAEITPEDLAIFKDAVDYISDANRGLLPGNAFEGEIKLSADESGEALSAGDANGESAESVLGADERVRVYSTTRYPYRTMGRIDVGCTGTLIGPRHVLTAGHCVYNINSDRWYTNLSFSPGQNGSSRPYGKIGWKKAISVNGWTRSHSKNYDYAMIVLNSPIGNTTGWLGYGYKNGWWSMNVNVNGYPADKSWGTMWHEYCKMDTVWYNSRRVTHKCDTYGGMSGSGLYRYLNGSRTIYAVHTHGGSSSNSGTRINSSVFNNLKSWKSQNP